MYPMFLLTSCNVNSIHVGRVAGVGVVGGASIKLVRRAECVLALSIIVTLLSGHAVFAEEESLSPKQRSEYALSEYVKCAANATLGLELSGEPASTVAMAALTSCNEQRRYFVVSSELVAIVDYNLTAKEAEEAMEEHIVRIDEALRRTVELAVLQSRAAARSKPTP